MRILFFAFSLSLILSSCNTLNSVVKAKEAGEGTTKIYDVGMDEAWTISKKVFRWGGSDAIDEYNEEGYMLTSSGANLVSMGAVMGAWFEPINAGRTKVTVITKRRVATNIATTLTEKKYHQYYNEAVKIVNRGEKLPFEAPSTK